jgi:hypothetical protein
VVFEFKILNGEKIGLKKLNIIGQIYIRVYTNIKGLTVFTANKFAALKLDRESSKGTSMEMGVKCWERAVYMDIAES